MVTIQTSIGNKFERFLQKRFPDLVSTPDDENVIPDFRHKDEDFWLEAKVGYFRWGPRVKDYQIKAFTDFDDPVIYALGFHDLDRAHERITQKTERARQNYLDSHMGIFQICFVNSEFMELLWEREKRLNGKGTIEYCMVKQGTINNIFQNREFVRSGEIVTAEEFYGFSYKDYNLFDTQDQGVRYRGILKRGYDKAFEGFLRDNKIIT